ncbi:MAG: HNH endonuclease family protein [Actinomycetaceae bacterium]|nr:HNH endonuclease family protein [Actinomycetaceae bacterium]
MLQNRGQSGRIPDDAEFKEAFKTRDFYRMRPGYRTYFFDLVERGTSKDIADIAARLEGNDISIEHIMPQTLSKKWRDELGSEADSIHTTWVNRAANLTITGYNSEYSNLPFEKKLTMSGGFKDSPYFLNAFVKDQDEWGLQQLEARSELLANRAMELWPYPTTTFEPMKETVPFEPMGTDTVFTNRDVVAVEIEGTKTPASTWANAMVIVLRALLELDREAVLKMANETRLLTSEDVAETVASNRGWRQVDPALAVLVGASTAARIGLLRKICEKVGYDPYDIVFYLRPEQETSQKSGASVPIEDSPYSDLIELIPLISEVEGTQLSQTETLELQNNLSEAVSNHVIEEPQAVIGGKDLGTFLSMHESGDISADQALACLTIYQTMANMMGPKIWHDAMLDGDVSKLLTALTKSK